MSRSKRLVGVANAIPGSGAAYGGTSAPQIELLQALILLFLVLDVLTDCLLVPPHSRDVVPSGPEMLAHEIAPTFAVDAGQVDWRSCP